MTLEGFEDYYGPNDGLQERATKDLIDSCMEGRPRTPSAREL